jgi:hypothetical protein
MASQLHERTVLLAAWREGRLCASTKTTPYNLHHGDRLEGLRTLPDESVDSVVTDPPYELEFLGTDWDKFGGTIEPSTDTRNRDGNWTTASFGGGGQWVRLRRTLQDSPSQRLVRGCGPPSACACSSPAATCSRSGAPAHGTDSRAPSRTRASRSATRSRGCTGV